MRGRLCLALVAARGSLARRSPFHRSLACEQVVTCTGPLAYRSSTTQSLSFAGAPLTRPFSNLAEADVASQPPAKSAVMLSTLRIVFPPSSDNQTLLPFVTLLVDGQRYIFNVPEGSTRIGLQRGARIARTEHVFVNSVGTENAGLAGMIMSLADSGISHLTLHGPSALSHLVCTFRTYARRESLLLRINDGSPNKSEAEEASGSGNRGKSRDSRAVNIVSKDDKLAPPPFFKDQWVTVHGVALRHAEAMPVYEERSEHTNSESGRRGPPQDGPANKRRRTESHWQGNEPEQETAKWIAQNLFPGIKLLQAGGVVRRPPLKPLPRLAGKDFGVRHAQEASPSTVMCWIVEHPAQRGKFNADAAEELGIPDGPPRSKLLKEGSVTFQRPTKWPDMDADARNKWVFRHKNLHDAMNKASRIFKGRKNKQSKEMQAAKEANEEMDAWETETITIQSSQVVGETRKGSSFVQIYCPSLAFLPSLLSPDSQAKFERYFYRAQESSQDNDRLVSPPHVVIHAVPDAVLTDPRYQDFVAHFGPGVNHIISNGQYATDTHAFSSSALSQLRLSRLDGKTFKPTPYAVAPTKHVAPDLKQKLLGSSASTDHVKGSVRALDQDTQITIQPVGPFSKFPSHAPAIHAPLQHQETLDLVSFKRQPKHARELGNDVRAKLKDMWHRFGNLSDEIQKAIKVEEEARRQSGEKESELILTSLGTGSAAPSKYRNVTATLVHIPRKDDGGELSVKHHYVLLDCGEATLGQLCRRFGRTGWASLSGDNARYEGLSDDLGSDDPDGGVEEILQNLKLVFLSHIHGDHHMGIARLLVERAKLHPTTPLYIICSRFISQYLTELDAITPLGLAPPGIPPSAAQRQGGVIFLDAESFDFETGVDVAVDLAQAQASGTDLLTYECRAQDELLRNSLAKQAEERAAEHAAKGEGKDPKFSSDPQEVLTKMFRSRLPARHHARSHLAFLKRSLGFAESGRIHTVEVDHRVAHCTGIILRSATDSIRDHATETPSGTSDPWSLAYSGDTRPCTALARAGKGVEVLIHEASLDDSQPEMAWQKGHSTFGQAIAVGKAMHAKRIYLTHFSQRYPKLPKITASNHYNTASAEGLQEPLGDVSGVEPIAANSTATAATVPIAIAFDLVSVPLKEMWKYTHYIPALELLFNAVKDEDAPEEGAEEANTLDGGADPAPNGDRAGSSASGALQFSQKMLEELADVAMNGSAPRKALGPEKTTSKAAVEKENGQGRSGASASSFNVEQADSVQEALTESKETAENQAQAEEAEMNAPSSESAMKTD
ncbi:hypothetical protein IE81DRAFT_253936 [Ceraceosorus guamensis]|uniref:ribonuclease Z n=1 Tax=Ceraceosorus guamensis TaxID=1522189 RepID=A0A316W497_9BASI|nr:hypothetical protein IE81DRAFT_253936 [Ceraceosorus guamensis]PWN44746.1 hypothetical protein IE81DRAFT_253936 [Ceraceosorus guamensis]